MALIDQRILIDAPPQLVWDFISDPARIPYWHAEYRTISVLTTRQTGLGTRRRCTLIRGGRDVIEEITAWVDGLGYEYRHQSGSPYRSLQGRIRLQASPDGTSVQWTVSYRLKGVFGGLRDRMGHRRQVTAMMAASLRQLRRRIDEVGVRMAAEERAKVAIQGRLSAEERAHYQVRHAPPPAPAAEVPASPFEPALPSESELAVPSVPSFVSDLAAESDHLADTEPKPPKGLREAIEMQAVQVQPPPPPVISPPSPEDDVPEHQRLTPPRGIASVRPAGEPTSGIPAPAPSSSRVTPARGVPSVVPGEGERRTLPPPLPKHDTGELSIWEVFGLRRPSEESAEFLEDFLKSVRPPAEGEPPSSGRRVRRSARVRLISAVVGLRMNLALHHARVRARKS